MNLRQMLVEMLSKGASDLHLRVGIRPTLRIDGVLTHINTPALSKEDMNDILNQILKPEQQKRFLARNEMDLALSVAKLGQIGRASCRERVYCEV